MNFQFSSSLQPKGDQKNAIEKLSNGIYKDIKYQTLLGVTGSGKTYTMAKIIEKLQKPALIISHNKTLAAQLYSEFKSFFKKNSVQYFVSYYDYYQPEAYVVKKDLYIEKESDINESIEKYRNAATQSLLTRKDTIIVASVSCIYGLGDPENYNDLKREVIIGMIYPRNKLIRHLIDLQYERNENDFSVGKFRVKGDTIDIFLVSGNNALRIEFFGDEIESLKIINPISGEIISKPKKAEIFPAKHFVTEYEALLNAIPEIQKELDERIKFFKEKKMHVQAERIKQRVTYDIEMLKETGYCSGIENYTRYIYKREPGSPPSTLMDYYPNDWILFIDESHITIPQIRGMYNGDRRRKEVLVDYGFRLPSALDNRPLKFDEFLSKINKAIFVSATPNEYEINLSKKSAKLKIDNYNGVAEQLIRPTGLLDPQIFIRPSEPRYKKHLLQQLRNYSLNIQSLELKNKKCINQIDDLILEIRKVVSKNQRVLVTTLTKKMAEDLASFLKENGIKVTYLHSEIDTVERIEILRNLRLAKFDVVVGINLLREGLDLPEVSLVAILDADKEGFLRSHTSLIQIIGRASRHIDGKVLMYADNITKSIASAVKETNRRRIIQENYNKKNHITPKSIQKEIKKDIQNIDKKEKKKKNENNILFQKAESFLLMNKKEQKSFLNDLQIEMMILADSMEFEKAAQIRDLIADLKKKF